MTDENGSKFKDIYGKPVPDSCATPGIIDMLYSTGDYDTDCKNRVGAHLDNGTRMLLSSVARSDVRFVSGLWRVQNQAHKYNVIDVRDKRFILGDRINHNEKNLFEYYHAALYVENCYGVLKPQYSYIVAKYNTDNGPMWSYGLTIEQARAFLGIALFDKHIDMIHSTERMKLR